MRLRSRGFVQWWRIYGLRDEAASTENILLQQVLLLSCTCGQADQGAPIEVTVDCGISAISPMRMTSRHLRTLWKQSCASRPAVFAPPQD